MRCSRKALVLVAAAAWVGSVQVCAGQAAAPAGISQRVLPSLVALKVQRTGGVTASGTAFVAVKDGLLVTAAHVLRDAIKVSATFPNGEEFDCAGIVDRDDRHNLALIRIRAFGRPVLTISPGELPAGEKVFVGVVKDGAFGVVEAGVADAVVQSGIKFYRLAGQIPDGNNGSPVTNAAGEVVGLHVTVVQGNQSAEMVLPSAYILGLEPSLPVQPWASAAPSGGVAAGAAPAVPTAAAASPDSEEIDVALAAALTNLHDWWAIYGPFSRDIYRISLYSNLKNLDLYTVQSKIDSAINSLRWLKPADALRDKLVPVVAQLLASERQAIDLDLQCWLLNKDAPPGKRNPQAEDAARRAAALFDAVPPQVASLRGDFRRLAQESPKFLAPLPPEMRYFLGLDPRKSKLALGIYLQAVAPMQVLSFAVAKPLAGELGLRGGDLIVSAAGRKFKPQDDMEDFKLLVESNAGRTLEVVVQRGGTLKTLQVKVPADVVQRYGRTPGDAPQ
jgi:S1-C subfamily serine protease